MGARRMGGHFVDDVCTHCAVHPSLMSYVNCDRKINKAFLFSRPGLCQVLSLHVHASLRVIIRVYAQGRKSENDGEI